MNEIILTKVKQREQIIAELKKVSHYWPQTTVADYPTGEEKSPICRYFSTLVRIERENKWYVVHCVESYFPAYGNSDFDLLSRLNWSVYNIQNLYMITGKYEEVDSLQISEVERLKQLLL